MNHAQKYLAQANRQIAELRVQIAGQRVVVKHALDTGQRLEMAESLLHALEESVRIFEKHQMFLLSCRGSFSASPPSKYRIRHATADDGTRSPIGKNGEQRDDRAQYRSEI